MRYYKSGRSYRDNKPKKGWRLGPRKRQRKFVHYEEVGAVRYANPFTKKGKGIAASFKTYFFATLFFSWIGLLIYLPFFRVTNIQYSGLKIIKQSEVEDLIKGEIFKDRPWLPTNNYFFLNENAIAKDLQTKYLLNAISVAKIFPNTLKISVVEKTTSAIYDNGSAYYLVDANGSVLKFLRNVSPDELKSTSSTPSTTTHVSANTSSPSSTVVTTTPDTHVPNFSQLSADYGTFPIIVDEEKKPVSEKDSVIDSGTIQGILTFSDALSKNKLAKANYFTIAVGNAGATAVTDRPWKVQFEPKGDIDKQLSNLQIILKDNHPTEYIDLRFGDRIYWK